MWLPGNKGIVFFIIRTFSEVQIYVLSYLDVHSGKANFKSAVIKDHISFTFDKLMCKSKIKNIGHVSFN